MSPEKFKQLSEMADRMVREEGMVRIEEARRRNLLRTDLAHWEIAELFHYCLPLAIFDALRAEDFVAFEQQWLPITGNDATGWLPSLYLAAVSSPAFVPEVRQALVRSALPYLAH